MNLNPWSRGARRAFPTLRTLLAAGMVLTTFSAMAADTGDKPRRPNVVVFLVDDMGWRDSAVYGSRYYETPHIDALARRGILFTDAYAACPLCSPTRAALSR